MYVPCLSFISGGSDFSTDLVTATFTTGNPRSTTSIVIIDDNVLEPDEDFVAHLIVPNNTLEGRVTVGDLDQTTVTIIDEDGEHVYAHIYSIHVVDSKCFCFMNIFYTMYCS